MAFTPTVMAVAHWWDLVGGSLHENPYEKHDAFYQEDTTTLRARDKVKGHVHASPPTP